jgi:hypothetical protein
VNRTNPAGQVIAGQYDSRVFDRVRHLDSQQSVRGSGR